MKQFTRLAATLLLVLAATSFFAGCEHESVQPQPGGTEPPRDTTSTTWTPDDWVDLGLPSGLLWAKRNVGATSPEDFGHYFAWGETSPKAEYGWGTYRYCNGNYNQLTKYCTSSLYGYDGFVDNAIILSSDDDAATANYGGRTPTNAEWQELMEYVVSNEWTTQNGVTGRRLTGPNGNRIFLPAAGLFDFISHKDKGVCGYYWSRSVNPNSSNTAMAYYFRSDQQITNYSPQRCLGLPVRAVCRKP